VLNLLSFTLNLRDNFQNYNFYNFVNENNLDYNGVIPDFTLFEGISHDEYDGITSYDWNLRNEAIRYCEKDCVSLFQIIIKFSELIFQLFNINIHKYPTLSSLAFGIFRTHFLEENIIPQLSGEIAKDIRQGYTGGAVDMYIPKNPDNTLIYCYDVNSLYPSQMLNESMPIGKPVLFYGDIRKVEANAFGFFYCNIIAPDNLIHPILQTHVKINNTYRTIAPLGQWSDMIFSAEMDNAMKLGYKFEILWGYKFEHKIIFKDYVENLYQFRLNYPKSNPLNLTAKLLLNSLYGRFGMDDSFPDITIFDSKNLFNTWFSENNENVFGTIELGDKLLVQHRNENKFEHTMLYSNLETHNVSIGIAAAITAYARIHMSQFKNNPLINLYYSDTDSIYTDSDIESSLIDNKVLGKLKLENICNKAIFLTPKVYCLLTETGEFIHKVKGLSHEIELTFEDFEKLLIKDFFIEKSQTKWFRNLSEGKINLLNQLYSIKVNDNKRKLIYKNNKLFGTNPYKINKDKIIVN